MLILSFFKVSKLINFVFFFFHVIGQAKAIETYKNHQLTLTSLICFFGTILSFVTTLVMEHNASVWTIGWDMNLLAAAYAVRNNIVGILHLEYSFVI
jgi:hypothetical protein